MAAIKAYNDMLIVEVKAAEETSRGGLFLPPASQSGGVSFGVVLDIGPGFLMEGGFVAPLQDVLVGDTVVFTPQSATEFTVDGQKLHAVRYGTLLGRMKRDTDNAPTATPESPEFDLYADPGVSASRERGGAAVMPGRD